MKNLVLFLLGIFIYAGALAQNEKKEVISENELFNKIASLDSMLFNAYNSKNLDLMKTFFTKDLEWYQDNGGLINFEQVLSIFNPYLIENMILKET